MKAILLAGGEGTRLRPITESIPKPLVPLPGGTAAEMLLRLCRTGGIREAAVTAGKNAPALHRALGDRCEGVRLTWFSEETPLGTAGGAAECRKWLGTDRALVVSGDSVCDFDFSAAEAWHASHGAEATILLARRADPREFGLVQCTQSGSIRGFSEKPGWEEVFTDLVSTGIYLLEPELLSLVPEHSFCDFGKDLFPRLLRDGHRLYGYEAPGYWQDMGTPESYRTCCRDMLAGKLSTFSMPQSGILTRSPIPSGVTVLPPVYIGAEVSFSDGCRVGPGTVLGAGCRLERGAQAEGSILFGVELGEGARARDAILCPGCVLETGAEAEPGSIAAPDSRIGVRGTLAAGGRLHTGCSIPAGTRAGGGLAPLGIELLPVFSAPGLLTGCADTGLSPEVCLRLGRGAAALGDRVGVFVAGDDHARLLSEAFGAGVCAAGGCEVRPDCVFAAQAAYAARMHGFAVTAIFRSRDGMTEVQLLGENGRPIPRDMERTLEKALREPEPAPARHTGCRMELDGVIQDYLASAAGEGLCRGCTLAVRSGSRENRALTAVLSGAGVTLASPGAADTLSVPEGGFGLTASLSDGRQIGQEGMLLAAAYAALERGIPALAVPADAPGVLEDMAKPLGGRILRPGRDAEAAEVSLSQPFLLDGIFMALEICRNLAAHHRRLGELLALTPDYSLCRRAVTVEGDPAAVLRALSRRWEEVSGELCAGVASFPGVGKVHISPMRGRSALLLWGEAGDFETARSLCGTVEAEISRSRREKSEKTVEFLRSL